MEFPDSFPASRSLGNEVESAGQRSLPAPPPAPAEECADANGEQRSAAGLGSDDDTFRKIQPGDKAGIDGGAGGRVIFADAALVKGRAGVDDVEVVARNGNAVGRAQAGDEVGAD